jgi:conserved oligomeric Golgi complex subunit 3
MSRLQQYLSECDHMIDEVEQCLEFLTVLKTDYVRVATKTNALHEACENLLEDQASNIDVSINGNLQ